MELTPLRYAIVEDEPPARSLIKSLLTEVAPGSLCIGEAEDGTAALELLRRIHPGVLFLDIEFPPDGAFGLLEATRREGLALPPIVFVTAFDQYAVEAFRWAACDFLLKPVEPGRLRETLRRLKPPPDLDLLHQALAAGRQNQAPERFIVRVKDRMRILRFSDVSCFRSESRLVFAYTHEGRFIVDRSLEELESLLPGKFFRIHRSGLVNLDFVVDLLPDVGHTSEIRLQGGQVLQVSRDRLAALKRCLA